MSPPFLQSLFATCVDIQRFNANNIAFGDFLLSASCIQLLACKGAFHRQNEELFGCSNNKKNEVNTIYML